MSVRNVSSTAVGAAHEPSPEVSWRHPAVVATVFVVVAIVVWSVSYAIYDPDLFQHLTVGRALWQTHAIPMQHVWTWPHYGQPEVLPSWLFRALLWPFWTVGGVVGLFVWRWLTTLAVMGLVVAASRRAGARGLSTLVVVSLAALVYRERSMVRPETFVSILLALELLILETRRTGGRDRALGLIAVLVLWVNAHVSFPLGLVVMLAYAVGDRGTGGRRAFALDQRLLGVTALAAAACLLNPFGWRGVWQPFDYFLHLRNEPLFRGIVELQPIDAAHDLRGPLSILLPVWPLLLAWRARRVGVDRAGWVLCLVFTALAIESRRFTGFYSVVAPVFVSRDLATWLAYRGRSRRPWSVTARAAGVAALAVVATLGVALGDRRPVGVFIRWNQYPVRACDRIAQLGIRGRGYNPFGFGGYQLWRFFPERDRLPFIDIHQTGTPLDRRQYFDAQTDPAAWAALDSRYRFDYALLRTHESDNDRICCFLDADPRWALVFMDDAAMVYVRRDGALRTIAAEHGYRYMAGSDSALAALGERCARDSSLRAPVRRELERMAAESPEDAQAWSLLGNLAALEPDWSAAAVDWRRALTADPLLETVHQRLALAALATDQPAVALAELSKERALGGWRPGLSLLKGQAERRRGRIRDAIASYRDELRRDPTNQEARDSLAALGIEVR